MRYWTYVKAHESKKDFVLNVNIIKFKHILTICWIKMNLTVA